MNPAYKAIEREYLACVRHYNALLGMEEKSHRLNSVILMLNRQIAEYERFLGRNNIARALRRYGLFLKT
jgi:hypothetical protein